MAEDLPHKTEKCEHCGVVSGWTYKKRGTSVNRFQIGLVCNNCNRLRSWAGGKIWTPKEVVKSEGHEIESLYWHVTGNDFALPPCIVCGGKSDEEHHFGPRSAFGNDECEKWPKGYLCVPCHVRWHKMVDGFGKIARELRHEQNP